MHNLKSKGKYKLVTIQVAVEADCSDSDIYDSFNDMLNEAIMGEPQISDPWIADYQFVGPTGNVALPIVQVGMTPNEGDPFDTKVKRIRPGRKTARR